MQFIPVVSSMLNAVRYEDDTGELFAVFHGGRTYVYEGVPPSIFAGLMAAPSKGRFMNANIIGMYPEHPVA